MTTTAKWYTYTIINAFGGSTAAESRNIDYLSDDIKVMLCTSSYTPDQDAHKFKSDITNEVSGAGYTTGGASLTNKTLFPDTTNNGGVFDADDVSWPNSTITARYAIIYDNTPSTDANKILMGYVDFGEDKASNTSEFRVQWAINGIFGSNAD